MEAKFIVGPHHDMEHAPLGWTTPCLLFRKTLKSYVTTLSVYGFLVLKAKAPVTVHDPLGQVDVPVLPLAIHVLEPGSQDGLVFALNVEANVLSSLKEVLASPCKVAVFVADARVQVDLRLDVLAILTGNAASEDVAIVDANAGDLAGVVEVGHVEFGGERAWLDLKRRGFFTVLIPCLPRGRSSSLYVRRFCHEVTYQLLTDFRMASPSPREPTELQGDSSREGGNIDVNTWAVTCDPHRISCGSAASSWGAKGC